MPDEEETPTPEAPKTETKERRVAPAVEKPAASGGHVVAAGAGAPAVVVMQPPAPTMPAISRRKVLLIGFWAGMGAMLAGIAATILTSLYPRGIKGFGSTIFVGTIDALAPGAKIHNLDAKTWLVRLDAEQAKHNPPAAEGSVLALYHSVRTSGAQCRGARTSRARTRGTTRRTQAGSSARAMGRRTAAPASVYSVRPRDRWTCSH
jgi:hypothetical protein